MAEGAAGADSDGEDAIITSLRALLGLKMRILASDGRVFQGVFMCIDKGRNIVLSGCEEYNREDRRYIGMAMVPGKHIIKAEVEDFGAANVQ